MPAVFARKFLLCLLIGLNGPASIIFSQQKITNTGLVHELSRDTAYTNRRARIIARYQMADPGKWGEYVNGMYTAFVAEGKEIALTFDACGGPKGSGYDQAMISYLRREDIPATLFVSGRWIDANYQDFVSLAADTLFAIENHGLNHKPCSLAGHSAYGIQGTRSPVEAYDEVVVNAIKIRRITGRNPALYRSSTGFVDETAVKLAADAGIRMVSYTIISGDAVPDAPVDILADYVIRHAKAGAIVIMHFNHPEWNGCEALKKIVPALRANGYRFVRLDRRKLIAKK